MFIRQNLIYNNFDFNIPFGCVTDLTSIQIDELIGVKLEEILKINRTL